MVGIAERWEGIFLRPDYSRFCGRKEEKEGLSLGSIYPQISRMPQIEIKRLRQHQLAKIRLPLDPKSVSSAKSVDAFRLSSSPPGCVANESGHFLSAISS